MDKKTVLVILVTIISLLSVSCNFPLLNQDRDSAQEESSPANQPAPEILILVPYEYSGDQQVVLQNTGDPTRFSLIFTKNDRQETWYYDTIGYTVTFVNGEFAAEKYTVPQYQENMYATTYAPNQFYDGMRFDEIMASTGRNEYTISEIEGMDRDAHLLHLEGLAIGLLEGRISFVETYPAMTERKLDQADFATESRIYTPTPEEAANKGSHQFLVVTYINGEFDGEDKSEIDISFQPDEVFINQNGIISSYQRVEPNLYTDPDGVLRLRFIADGFIWFEPSVNGSNEVEILHSRLDD